MCLKKYLIFFLVLSVLATHLLSGPSLAAENINKQFEQCVDQLSACDNDNQKLKELLNKEKLENTEDKVFFIFKASDVTAFGIGFLTGIVISSR